MKRNIDMHTPAEAAKRNILTHLARVSRDHRNPSAKAVIGKAAFPEYDFKRPQGAAFAVAKLVRELEDDGLVCHAVNDCSRGYYISAKGLACLATQEAK